MKLSKLVSIRKQNRSDSYYILRILSIIIVAAVIHFNFINVWLLSSWFLLVIVAAYIIYIFYPRKITKNTIMDTVKFALGAVSIFSGISLLVFVVKSFVIHDFPFNVGIIISLYAIFWIVIGWLLVANRYAKKK